VKLAFISASDEKLVGVYRDLFAFATACQNLELNLHTDGPSTLKNKSGLRVIVVR
jgi:hypothetical protein